MELLTVFATSGDVYPNTVAFKCGSVVFGSEYLIKPKHDLDDCLINCSTVKLN